MRAFVWEDLTIEKVIREQPELWMKLAHVFSIATLYREYVYPALIGASD